MNAIYDVIVKFLKNFFSKCCLCAAQLKQGHDSAANDNNEHSSTKHTKNFNNHNNNNIHNNILTSSDVERNRHEDASYAKVKYKYNDTCKVNEEQEKEDPKKRRRKENFNNQVELELKANDSQNIVDLVEKTNKLKDVEKRQRHSTKQEMDAVKMKAANVKERIQSTFKLKRRSNENGMGGGGGGGGNPLKKLTDKLHIKPKKTGNKVPHTHKLKDKVKHFTDKAFMGKKRHHHQEQNNDGAPSFGVRNSMPLNEDRTNVHLNPISPEHNANKRITFNPNTGRNESHLDEIESEASSRFGQVDDL